MLSDRDGHESLESGEASPQFVRHVDETKGAVQDFGPESGLVQRLRTSGEHRIVRKRKSIIGRDAETVTEGAVA